MTHEEKVTRAIAALCAKHNRTNCDDNCPTLIVLEELLRLQQEERKHRGRHGSH